MPDAFDTLLKSVRDCRICAAHLPLGPRPVVQASQTARLLIIGQAPGTRVHETGIPWNDASGERLRDWLRLDRDRFYDPCQIAIVPMGFCYPGRDPKGGDNPPRPECAPTWHAPLLRHLPQVEVTLLIGMHAQARYLAKTRKKTMTETVAAFREYGPDFIPLPHPSWRNTAWIKRNPWFERDTLVYLRARMQKLFPSN
ncbi:uracil-DNA glycosylase family protein [Limibacillus sp. MBR-115]|uniref:uracil-DNA glycosylase family protein n=1 Tax=Limibacillus sp. MBR-115 TaxID=3156465 RepID=UPI00339133D3